MSRTTLFWYYTPAAIKLTMLLILIVAARSFFRIGRLHRHLPHHPRRSMSPVEPETIANDPAAAAESALAGALAHRAAANESPVSPPSPSPDTAGPAELVTGLRLADARFRHNVAQCRAETRSIRNACTLVMILSLIGVLRGMQECATTCSGHVADPVGCMFASLLSTFDVMLLGLTVCAVLQVAANRNDHRLARRSSDWRWFCADMHARRVSAPLSATGRTHR